MRSPVSIILLITLLLAPFCSAQENENITLLGRWAYGPCYAAAGDNVLTYFGNGNYFQIADFDDPSDPELLSELLLPFNPLEIFLLDDRAYVACGEGGLIIIDISDPTEPILLGVWETEGEVMDVMVIDDLAYIANGSDEMRILDVSNPAELVEIGFFNTRGVASGVDLVGDICYVADGDRGLRIGDISNPQECVQLGLIDTESNANSVEVQRDFAYVADGEDGLVIINVSNPEEPFITSSIETRGYSSHVTVRDSIAFVTDDSEGLVLFNIYDQENPEFISNWSSHTGVNNVFLDGNLVYLADSWYAFRLVDVSNPEEPQELGGYETYGFYNAITRNGNYLYMGSAKHMLIMDVSDPSAPDPIGEVPVPSSPWEIAFWGDYLFTTNFDSGMTVYDVTDPLQPSRISTLPFDRAYGFTIDGDYAFVGCSLEGLYIFDIRDQENLEIVTIFNEDILVEDVAVRGDYAYLSNFLDFVIVDISDINNPRRVGEYLHWADGFGIELNGDYAYIAGGDYGVLVFDISEPENPILEYSCNTVDFAFEVYMEGDYLYVTDWEGGVLVFDITEPSRPDRVGYFDTADMGLGVISCEEKFYVTDGSDGLYIFQNDHYASVPNHAETPVSFRLHPNFPNPFNGSTFIRFDLDRSRDVTVKVFNLLGDEVSTVHQGILSPGFHALPFNGHEIPSGSYIYRIQTGGESQVDRMILLK